MIDYSVVKKDVESVVSDFSSASLDFSVSEDFQGVFVSCTMFPSIVVMRLVKYCLEHELRFYFTPSYYFDNQVMMVIYQKSRL